MKNLQISRTLWQAQVAFEVLFEREMPSPMTYDVAFMEVVDKVGLNDAMDISELIVITDLDRPTCEGSKNESITWHNANCVVPPLRTRIDTSPSHPHDQFASPDAAGFESV